MLAIRVFVWRTTKSWMNHTNTKAMQDLYAWWIWGRLRSPSEGSPKHLGGVLGVVKACLCLERIWSCSNEGCVKACMNEGLASHPTPPFPHPPPPPWEKNRTGIAPENKKTRSGGVKVGLPDTCIPVMRQSSSIRVDVCSSKSSQRLICGGFQRKNEAKLLKVLDVNVSEVVTIECKTINGFPSVFAWC